jgi:hypothetical protein
MIVRHKGGLTEFIPSPQEKREGLIRDHVLGLIEKLHMRIKKLEQNTGLPLVETKRFEDLLHHIKKDESRNHELHNRLSSIVPDDTE